MSVVLVIQQRLVRITFELHRRPARFVRDLGHAADRGYHIVTHTLVHSKCFLVSTYIPVGKHSYMIHTAVSLQELEQLCVSPKTPLLQTRIIDNAWVCGMFRALRLPMIGMCLLSCACCFVQKVADSDDHDSSRGGGMPRSTHIRLYIGRT